MKGKSLRNALGRSLIVALGALRLAARPAFLAGALLACCVAAGAPSPKAETGGARALRVVMDDNYPPYVFRDVGGALNGYLVDSWRLWQEKTGVPVELIAGDWEKMQQRMASGEADVIDTIFRTPERAKTLDFGPAYARVPVTIYVHTSIGGIADLKTLRGFLVGVKAGDACASRLEAAGIDTLQRFPNYQSLVQAAVAEKIRLFCLDEPPANYLLYRVHAEGAFRKAFELFTGEFHRGVKRGDAETLALVETGFAAITPAERRSLQEKWMGSSLSLSPYARYLGHALLAAVLIGGVLALWGFALRRTVKQRTAQLGTERASLQALVQTIPDLIWLKDMEGIYLRCNLAFERFFGAKEAEIVGKTDYDFVAKELADSFRAHDRKAVAVGGPSRNEEWLKFSDGSAQGLFEAIKTPIYDARGEAVGVLGIARDITARKQTEESLRLSEQKFAAAFRSSPDAMLISTLDDGRIVDVNAALSRVSGFGREEMIGHSGKELGLWSDAKVHESCFAHLREIGRVDEMEGSFRIRSGEIRTGQIYAERIEIDQQPHVLWVIRDITEHKLAQAKIFRLTRLYAALSECRQAIVRSATEEALFERICWIAVEFGGMKTAWISRLDATSRTLGKVASFRDDTGYLDDVRLPMDASDPLGRGPTASAVRENRPMWCQDFANDPKTGPWREHAAKSGWAASAALPLHRNGAVAGAFTIYSGEVNAFDEVARNLLIEIALDIDLALTGFDREAERRRAESALVAANRNYDELTARIPVGIYKLRQEAGGSVRFDYVSSRFCTMLGLEPEAVRRDAALAYNTVHPESRAEFLRLNEEARFSLKKFSWEGRVLVNGQERWMQTESQPTREDNGDIVWDGVQMDVTERRRMENELAGANQRLQALSTRLLQVQEEERRTLARELHDEIGQSLTALKITLQSLNLRPETEALRGQIDMAIGITDTALKQARQMSLDLRPAQLDDLGLPAAIRWNLERQCSLAGLLPRFSTDSIPARVAEPVSIACYRISQEAITNVIRHAAANTIGIALTAGDGKITLEICDDGRGFDAAPSGGIARGMGMVSMQERAALAGGELTIETRPEGGCIVRATFPLSSATT